MRYKLFGRGSGLRVSEVALGTALFGTRWRYGAEPEEARRMFDIYVDAGGNFIDTSDTYQHGQSEELLGEFASGRRDELIIATKFSLGSEPGPGLLKLGNSRKAMVCSVEGSLKRLRTDRIDLLWVHMPDSVTSSEELLRGLNDLVSAGKILYIGLSDFPAWRVARIATIAELRGWASLVGIQVEYSLVERTADRELLPMATALGLGTVGWSPLGGGLLTGKYRRGEEGRTKSFAGLVHSESDEIKTACVEAVLSIAKEAGVLPASIALAWLGTRGVIPILGPRTSEQLKENLKVLDLHLDPGQVARLNAASAIPLGFPHEMLAREAQRKMLTADLLDNIEAPSVPVS